MLDPQGEKHSVLERIELCEQRMAELAQKTDQMDNLATMIVHLLDGSEYRISK